MQSILDIFDCLMSFNFGSISILTKRRQSSAPQIDVGPKHPYTAATAETRMPGTQSVEDMGGTSRELMVVQRFNSWSSVSI